MESGFSTYLAYTKLRISNIEQTNWFWIIGCKTLDTAVDCIIFTCVQFQILKFKFMALKKSKEERNKLGLTSKVFQQPSSSPSSPPPSQHPYHHLHKHTSPFTKVSFSIWFRNFQVNQRIKNYMFFNFF